jgi:hypothetical protein
MAELITGDSRPYVANLTINGAAFEIPTGNAVLASLISADKKKVLIPPTEVASSATGSAWTTSKIVFKFTREQTAALTVADKTKALVEIQVELPDGAGTSDWTWWLPITILRGTIE